MGDSESKEGKLDYRGLKHLGRGRLTKVGFVFETFYIHMFKSVPMCLMNTSDVDSTTISHDIV